jgi:hypothetical protein
MTSAGAHSVITAFANARSARVKAAKLPANALITMLLVLFGLSTLKLR